MFEVPIQRDGESPQLTNDDHGDDRDPRVERRRALGIPFVTGSQARGLCSRRVKPATRSTAIQREPTTMPTGVDPVLPLDELYLRERARRRTGQHASVQRIEPAVVTRTVDPGGRTVP